MVELFGFCDKTLRQNFANTSYTWCDHAPQFSVWSVTRFSWNGWSFHHWNQKIFAVFIQKSLHLASTYTLHFMEHSNPSYPFLEPINLFPNISNILYLNIPPQLGKTKTIVDLFFLLAPFYLSPFPIPPKTYIFFPPPHPSPTPPPARNSRPS